jgi:GH25 family lysozyme M1 (1,4-beta-N-acetylmuramidase)
MRARRPLRQASLFIAVTIAVIGAAGAPAAARSTPSGHGGAQRVARWNVGNTHSPQLLRELAHTPARAAASPGGAVPIQWPAGVQGVDVAAYQHPNGAQISWPEVAAAGISFAAVKVTEGAYYTNPYAASDLKGAQAATLSVIAYAFAIPNGGTYHGKHYTANPVKQADYLLSVLAPQGKPPVLPVLPPVMLDIEYNPYGRECYGLTGPAMLSWIQRFATEIIAKTGEPPIIYSTQGWLDTCVQDTAALAAYPLWIAAYNGSTTSPGMLPNGWTDWGLWQWTSSGTVPGIVTSGATDLDVFNPDSFFQQGKLMVFNPGYQQYLVNSAPSVSAYVDAYPLEASPSLSFAVPPDSGWSVQSTPAPGVAEITGPASKTVGVTPLTVTVTDSNPAGGSGAVSFNWYAHGTLTIVSPGPQHTVAGAPVAINLAAGMTDQPSEPPVTFMAAGLPPGTQMSPAGLISGWPDAAGTYQVWVQAADSLRAPASESFTWKVTAAPQAGPTGGFRLAAGGRCLNDVGNRSRNGTAVDLWKCNGSAAQRWTYAQDFTVRIHHKCLTAPATAGGEVTLEACAGLAAQVWRLTTPTPPATGQTPLALVNSPSGLCLANPGHLTRNGIRVVATSCNGLRNQAWALPAGPIGSGVPGICMDDRGNRTRDGNPVDAWSCTGTARQRWTVRTDGTIRIHGKCLSLRGRGQTVGTSADLAGCRPAAAWQQWRLEPDLASVDGVDLVNPASGLCLTDPRNATRDGAPLRIRPCPEEGGAAAPGQVWHIL